MWEFNRLVRQMQREQKSPLPFIFFLSAIVSITIEKQTSAQTDY